MMHSINTIVVRSRSRFVSIISENEGEPEICEQPGPTWVGQRRLALTHCVLDWLMSPFKPFCVVSWRPTSNSHPCIERCYWPWSTNGSESVRMSSSFFLDADLHDERLLPCLVQGLTRWSSHNVRPKSNLVFISNVTSMLASWSSRFLQFLLSYFKMNRFHSIFKPERAKSYLGG